MNTKTTISAIVMSASILGMISLVSAFAENNKNPVSYCHYDIVVDEALTTEIDESKDSACSYKI